MINLLTEYIQLALNERVSTRDLRAMSRKEIYTYAAENLELLGEGSSRIVFLLSPKSVLKLAKRPTGLMQNEAEVEIYSNKLTKNLTTKIFDFARDYSWLVSELVRPVKDIYEFNALTGHSSIYDLGYIRYTPFEKEVYDAVTRLKLEPADLQLLEHWGVTADRRIVLLDYVYTRDVSDKWPMNNDKF